MDSVNGSAVKEIAALAKKEEVLFEVDGKTYCRESMERVFSDPRPNYLGVMTLSG